MSPLRGPGRAWYPPAMSERRIETYEEFWPFYVREHSDPTSRKLHFAGTTGTIGVTS